MRVIDIFRKQATTTGDQFFASGCTVGITKDKNEIIDSQCNRSCIFSFLLFSCLLWRPYEAFRGKQKVKIWRYFLLQAKLSRLCEQDKILQELETKIRSLKEDKVFSLCGLRHLNLFEPAHVHALFLLWPYLLWLRPGQAGVSAGCFTPADGAVQGPAGPRWEDCLSAEIITGGCRAHQGRNIPDLYGKTRISHNALHFVSAVFCSHCHSLWNTCKSWHCDI